jgi:hypothetical protein
VIELLQAFVNHVVAAAARVWPAVAGAACLGYMGLSFLGLPGFLIGAALGAVGGTWIGARLGLVPVRRMTGDPSKDMMLQALGGFVIVGASYMLMQVLLVFAVIGALAVLAFAWLQS